MRARKKQVLRIKKYIPGLPRDPLDPQGKCDTNYYYYYVDGAIYGGVSMQADGRCIWNVMINPKYRYGSSIIEGIAISMEGAKRIVELICQETDTCYPRKATI